MKKLLVISLALALSLGCGIMVQGAVHSGNSDFSTYGVSLAEIFTLEFATDSWYQITPVDPNLKLSYFRVEDEVSFFIGEYYLEDQTFFGLVHAAPDNPTGVNSELGLFGSYLFDFGMFIGIEYGSLDLEGGGPPYDSFYWFSPGYRYDLNSQGYLAASLDYLTVSDVDFAEIVGYDLDLVYYFDNARIYFQYYIPTDEGFLDDSGYDLGACLQLVDKLVVGFNYNVADEDYDFDLGLTWDAEFMILDFQVGGDETGDDYSNLGLLFQMSDRFHFGFEMYQEEDYDAQYTLKLKFTSANAELLLANALENDDYANVYYLNYQLNF